VKYHPVGLSLSPNGRMLLIITLFHMLTVWL